MGFPESYIDQDEDLILNLRPHWWQLAGPVAIAVGVLILLLVFAQFGVTALTWLVGIAFLASLVWLGVSYARWATTYFVLTSERLITRQGLVSKRGVEIPLDRINNVNFNQRLFERIIQAGDLLIESAGMEGQSHLTNVRKPDAVQNAILTAMEDYRSRFYGAAGQARAAAAARAPAPTPPPASAEESIPEKIRQLDELRKQGLISDADYDAKKADLLGRM